MKLQTTLMKILILLLLTTIILGCKKSDKDTQLPSIVLLQPVNNDQFEPGKDFTIVATFQDYVELASYRISIRWDNKAQNISPNPESPAWEVNKEGTLSGKLEALNIKINVDENIRQGNYELIITCVDKTGNEASRVTIIRITD
jgi:hypothetical protein